MFDKFHLIFILRNLQEANAYEESRTIQKLREDLCECERELRCSF